MIRKWFVVLTVLSCSIIVVGIRYNRGTDSVVLTKYDWKIIGRQGYVWLDNSRICYVGSGQMPAKAGLWTFDFRSRMRGYTSATGPLQPRGLSDIDPLARYVRVSSSELCSNGMSVNSDAICSIRPRLAESTAIGPGPVAWMSKDTALQFEDDGTGSIPEVRQIDLGIHKSRFHYLHWPIASRIVAAAALPSGHMLTIEDDAKGRLNRKSVVDRLRPYDFRETSRERVTLPASAEILDATISHDKQSIAWLAITQPNAERSWFSSVIDIFRQRIRQPSMSIWLSDAQCRQVRMLTEFSEAVPNMIWFQPKSIGLQWTPDDTAVTYVRDSALWSSRVR